MSLEIAEELAERRSKTRVRLSTLALLQGHRALGKVRTSSASAGVTTLSSNSASSLNVRRPALRPPLA